MIISNKRSRLLSILIGLTLFCLIAQISFFVIHVHVSALIDDLVKSSIKTEMLHPVILLPLFEFVSIQIISCIVVTAFIWFISISTGEYFTLSSRATYFLGILSWCATALFILTLNSYYYPDSFFALSFFHEKIIILAVFSGIFLITATIFSYFNFFLRKRHRVAGSVFLILVLILFPYDKWFLHFSTPAIIKNERPNIIFIGLDSLRPDFTHYFGNKKIITPNIDHFLETAATLTEVYTPLARTFPSWISILTGKYPKHTQARSNLADPEFILANKTLAKILQKAGYETIYATDEKRFSNITKEYGFDKILGPKMGLNDFILGGLNDFPLTNLLINLPIGKLLFPFNYGNRAAAITYKPEKFLQLVKDGLRHRQREKPLFFAVHLCTSHWPYTWAQDLQKNNLTMANRYLSSVESVDVQLGNVLQLLKAEGLLENSIVVLLSDHGTTLGLVGDRSILKKNYIGNKNQLKKIAVYKFDTASRFSMDFAKDYSMDTSIGQGTDILSLKQYHTLLAFKSYGISIPPHLIADRHSLLDIAPTVLEMFHLPSLPKTDGISFATDLFTKKVKSTAPRSFYLETGYSLPAIETNDINENKVIHHAIGFYALNPRAGLIFVKPLSQKLMIRNKQRAILMNDWLLAYYPASEQSKLIFQKVPVIKNSIVPAYFVLLNIKTGRWTIGLDSAFAKKAPLNVLLKEFYQFYGDEITSSAATHHFS